MFKNTIKGSSWILVFATIFNLVVVNSIKAQDNILFQKNEILNSKGSIVLKEFKGFVSSLNKYIELYVLDIDLDDSELEVVPAMSGCVEAVDVQAKKNNAIAAINAGFFDGSNGKTVSYVIVDGKVVGDPELNKNLTSNRSIQKYLPQIYNRGEIKRLRCGDNIEYKIGLRDVNYPECKLLDSVQGGPVLLPYLDMNKGAFLVYNGTTKIRESANVTRPDARIGVGLTNNNHMKWVILPAGFKEKKYFGLTIKEFSKLFKMLDVQSGLAFDGGSSTSFFYRQLNGKDNIIIGDVTPEGKRILPRVKSVLLLKKKDE